MLLAFAIQRQVFTVVREWCNFFTFFFRAIFSVFTVLVTHAVVETGADCNEHDSLESGSDSVCLGILSLSLEAILMSFAV